MLIHKLSAFCGRTEIKMKQKKIRITTIAEIRDFVNIVVGFDGEVDLISGRYVVDAKSIMGIFSLDLLSPIKLTVYSDKPEVLLDKIEKFIVK